MYEKSIHFVTCKPFLEKDNALYVMSSKRVFEVEIAAPFIFEYYFKDSAFLSPCGVRVCMNPL